MALSQQALYTLVRRHFGDLGPEVVETMYRIALRESGGDPRAYNGAGRDDSYGLFQVNVHPEANPDLAGRDLFNPEENARAARVIYDRQGPAAWTTYGGDMDEPMSTYNSRPDGGGGPADAFESEALLNGIRAAMPKPENYKDQEIVDSTGKRGIYSAAMQYQDGYEIWLENYQAALDIAKSEREMAAGLFRMEDGTIVSQADFDMLDPLAQAQVQARMAQQQRDLDNSWADIVNSLGLTEFTTKQGAYEKENERRSTDFQNRMSEFGSRLKLDEMDQETAVKQVNRQLDGLQESRGRAGLIQDALDKAAGWATTGGKTSFTPGDFGQALSVIAQFGGIAPDMPFLKFPGTRTVDPAALLTAQDQALGVTGPLPRIPDLLTSPGGIPSSPDLLTMPTAAPGFIYPASPVQMPAPQPAPRSWTLSEILGLLSPQTAPRSRTLSEIPGMPPF